MAFWLLDKERIRGKGLSSYLSALSFLLCNFMLRT